MDLTNQTFTTAFGEATFQDLLTAYEKQKQYAVAKAEWYKTEEGKAYNRAKAKQYYQRHKDAVLQKRSERYATDKDTLLNRVKEYYALHTEEILEKNKERRKRQQEVKKTEMEA